MPDGFKIASAYVAITPDTSGFAERLRAAVDGSVRDVQIPAALDGTRLAESAEKARREIEDEPPVKIPAEVDKDKVKTSAKDAGNEGGGLMATAMSGALLAGGPLVAAGMAGIGAAGMIALGAKLEAGNPAIQGAWHGLVVDAQQTGKDAASGLVNPISGALGTLDGLVKSEAPQLRAMFQGAGQDIPILAAGITNLADNALPGFANMLQQSQPIARGFATVLGDAGQAAGGLGNTVAVNASAIGSDVASIGSAVKTVGSAVDDVVGTTSQLAKSALPGLDGVLSTTEEALHGAAGAADKFAVPLGTVAGAALSGVLASKTLGAGLDTLGSKITSAGEKLTTGGGPLNLYGSSVSRLGGAVTGLAKGIPFVAAGISAVSSVVSDSYGTVAGFAGVVEQGGDAFSDAYDKAKAFGDGSKNVGTMLASFWDTVTGQGVPSLDNLVGSLNDVQKAQYGLDVAIKQGGPDTQDAIEAANHYGGALDASGNLTQAITEYQANYNRAVADFGPGSVSATESAGLLGQALEEQAAQTAVSRSAMTEQESQVVSTAAAMGVLADKTQGESTQVQALNTLMDNATNGNLSYAQAMATGNAALLSMAGLVKNNTDGLRGHAGALIDDTGLVNTATQAGQDLNQQLLTAATGYANVVVAAHDHALALGQSDTQAVEAATTAGQNFVTNLDTQLTKLGATKTEVDRVNAAYGLTKPVVSTSFQTPGLSSAQSAVDTYSGALNKIPPTKQTIFTFYENTIVNTPKNAPTSPPSLGNLMGLHAHGDLVLPMAGGGTLATTGLLSMAPIAQVVPPDSPRVVGDNLTTPEAYIPLDPRSQRSQAILSASNAAMGRTDAAPSVTNYNTWNVSTQDPYQAAQLVAAQQAWSSMIGAHG